MTRKPWSHVRILIYRTWAILRQKEKKWGQISPSDCLSTKLGNPKKQVTSIL